MLILLMRRHAGLSVPIMLHAGILTIGLVIVVIVRAIIIIPPAEVIPTKAAPDT